MTSRFLLGAVSALALLAGCGDGSSGPALTVPAAQLAKSVQCYGEPAGNAHQTVLLVHGTAETADQEWNWNYVPAIRALGWPVCTVTLPAHSMVDIQESAEYLVAAIRSLHALSGKKIQIIGHSQGGMSPRWALKYWPDTRAMVDDLVGLAASNHGTYDANVVCNPDCSPAFWQQANGSKFITALNAGGETFAGIDYTVAYTHYDEVVIPNADASGSSALHATGANVANIGVQDLCPNNTADHLAMGTYDPVAWAVALDALSHSGPALASRIAIAVCATTTMPGVDQASFASNNTANNEDIANTVQSYPHVAAEPPLRCYAGGPC